MGEKVFNFIDDNRKTFWEQKRKEIMELVDPSTGKIYDDHVHRINCPICNVDDSLKVFEKQGFDFVKCKKCGLLHVNPQLKPDICESFYKKSLMATHWIKLQTTPKEEEWNANAKYLPALNALKELKPDGGRLLDIGCSVGQFMHLSKNYRWEPVGIELNEEAACYARDHYHLRVHIEYLEKLDFPKNSFDLITLWGVLEHLTDPNGILRACRELLKEDGLLLLFVPNGHSLIVRMMRHYNSTVSGRAHLWYFTPSTMEMLLNKNGYAKVHEFSVLPQLHEMLHFLQYNIPYVESECCCEEEFHLTDQEKQGLTEIINQKKLAYKLITIAKKQ